MGWDNALKGLHHLFYQLCNQHTVSSIARFILMCSINSFLFVMLINVILEHLKLVPHQPFSF